MGALNGWIIRPASLPVRTQIDDSLDALQHAVGGYIQTVTGTNEVVFVCNEEGKLQGLPFNEIATHAAHALNAIYAGDVLCGNVLCLGDTGGENFIDLDTLPAAFGRTGTED